MVSRKIARGDTMKELLKYEGKNCGLSLGFPLMRGFYAGS